MEQSIKKFLRQFFIGATSVPLILQACKKEDLTTETDTGTDAGSGGGSGSCSVSPSETAGPFSTITPSSLVRSDIKDDRTGVAFTIKITIKNTNNSCGALANAIVDIWHDGQLFISIASRRRKNYYRWYINRNSATAALPQHLFIKNRRSMIRQEEAKIFLADERGVSEAGWFRSCSTFNFGKYYSEHKLPFSNIEVINDDSLDAGRSLQMLVEKDYYIVLIPVMGAIKYKCSTGESNLVAAGQSQFMAAKKGDKIQISNPFDEGVINFLQIWIRPNQQEVIRNTALFSFDVNKLKNNLQIISPTNSAPFSASMGKFDGRGETTYHVENEKAALFLFVVEGAFEVQGRLLHARDGLALWKTNHVEMEALSNDAIILVIETSEVDNF